MDLASKLLSDAVFYRTYAKHLPSQARRESVEEAINRSLLMDAKRFPHISKDLVKAYDKVHSFKVATSMRKMQFAGDAIEQNPIRSYNCCYLPVDDVRAFGETLFLLLSGTGVGFSVQSRHISKLPLVKGSIEESKYVVADTIMGWAEALDKLVEAYFFGRTRPIFDFTRIRPKGARLYTSGAKAPGPEPLKHALTLVESLLRGAIGRKLTSVEVYDMVCIAADCVLSGGIRRSATICLFDRFDEGMITCKMGKDWMTSAPWRMRANNSAVMPRGETTRAEFDSIYDLLSKAEFGEPGFIWSNNLDWGCNPCFRTMAPVMTPNGLSTIGQIGVGDTIWSGSEWTKVIKKWSTGVQKVYAYRTSAGVFYGTDKHRIVQNGTKIEVRYATGIDRTTGPIANKSVLDPQDIMDGLVLGDGTVHHASNNLPLLIVGSKDQEWLTSEVSHLFGRHRSGINDGCYEINSTLSSDEIPLTFDRKVPARFINGTQSKVMGFLRGLYSANGSVCGNRVTLKASSFSVIESVQFMLSFLGIKSYYTTNKAQAVEFANGTYDCKESYDLNITTDRNKFMDLIGFIQSNKQARLVEVCSVSASKFSNKSTKTTFDITEVEYLGEEEVFDITVDCDDHTLWCGGLLVSNCVEVSLPPFVFCNLTSINVATVTSEKDFLSRVHSAALLGTVQASYTNFPYLRPIWRTETERSALIGVSMTGIADCPIELTADLLRKGAELVKEINAKTAKKIGINPAHRTTVIKPEGSLSTVWGTSSGIHARHEQDYYVRRVGINKLDGIAAFLMKEVPGLCEESIYNKNDIMLNIPQKSPEKSISWNQETTLELFKRAMHFNKNWIDPGHVEGDNHNNVSCTLDLRPEEWEIMRDHLWNERNNYTGMSMFPRAHGYEQAPFEAITKERYDELMTHVKELDFTQIVEDDDESDLKGTAACAGGACEITRI